jgi:hypothetical protein
MAVEHLYSLSLPADSYQAMALRHFLPLGAVEHAYTMRITASGGICWQTPPDAVEQHAGACFIARGDRAQLFLDFYSN